MRLDVALPIRNLCQTRSRGQQYIKEGQVLVNGKVVTSPAFDVSDDVIVALLNPLQYVSRGGLKLEGALSTFHISPEGKNCLDVGASTGGFTDCLLQNGAKSVVALDVGIGQLAEKIRNDSRVTSLEKCNARQLSDFVSGPFDLIVMDVSFISATYILPQFASLLTEKGEAVVLVKPQFEVGAKKLNKKGIVKDPSDCLSALEKVKQCGEEYHLSVVNQMVSPVLGGDGNTEYLVHFRKKDETI